ncbi:hypothetical protein MHBO_000187 [Bonamia ostreae]|uniref:Uncharacterized protein n=1 Tax=Bonamia ostreae TaxID=126728 RepID=A0ABV2AEQ6_9EUKA
MDSFYKSAVSVTDLNNFIKTAKKRAEKRCAVFTVLKEVLELSAFCPNRQEVAVTVISKFIDGKCLSRLNKDAEAAGTEHLEKAKKAFSALFELILKILEVI